MPQSDGAGTKLIAQNRRARHDYDLEERFEAGLQLVGTEVKSCREAKVSLADAYATVRDGEAWLLQLHIAPYSHGNRTNHDPLRARKLLLNKHELERMEHAITRDGKTLVPLRLYFKQGLAKAEIAIAKGRKTHDKRHAIAQRSDERRMRQAEGRRR